MFLTVTLSLFEGLAVTIKLFALTLLFALPLGLIISFGSMSKVKVLRYPVKTLVWIVRGSPLMIQLLIVYYGLPIVFGMPPLPRFPAALIAFVFNYACYFSEIYRGGIEAIPKGQYEAGQVLGMTKNQIFFKVKRIVPPMSNEIITLVKDTSLARIIAVYELIWSGQTFIKSAGIIWPLFYTTVFYLVFNGGLTLLFGYIERKLDFFKC